MCVVEYQFVLWEEVLDIFGGFDSCKFSFLNGYNGWICILDYIV